MKDFSIQPSTALSATSILLGFTIFRDTIFLVVIHDYKVTHLCASSFKRALAASRKTTSTLYTADTRLYEASKDAFDSELLRET